MANKAVTYSVAIMLSASSLSPAWALVMTGPPPAPPPPAPAFTAGLGLTTGILAGVALLCLYDVWLKINGVKNWDGSPKTVQVVHPHHHPG